MHTISNVAVGKPDTSPSKPSRRAGVLANAGEPIDPRMPKLTPA